jgi:hypothetical protein
VTRSSLLSRSHGRGASLFRSSFSPLAAADGGCLPPSLCCVLLVLARPAASAVQRTDHHPAVGVRDTRIRFQMMYHVNSVRRQTGRSIYNTHQSYTVGLLGVPGASAPSAILPFRRSFFQPSPLGVVAAASRWQRTYRKRDHNISRGCACVCFRSPTFDYTKVASNSLQNSAKTKRAAAKLLTRYRIFLFFFSFCFLQR